MARRTTRRKPKMPKLRIPTAKGSIVHPDKKTDYRRRPKHPKPLVNEA